MKNSFKAFILGTGLSILTFSSGFGQLGDNGLILTGGVADAEQILTEYMRPLANSLGANLNGGWYNTAKVHGTLGFDITFTVSTSFTPDEAKIYDIGKLALQAENFNDPIAPTVSGEKGRGPAVTYNHGVSGVPEPMFEYDHPGGTGVGFLPSPMINAGVGLPKGFEIIGRYMPKVNFQGVESGLWGFGLKHDIGQWIPFVKRVPVLHFTLMYGYTNLNVNAGLNEITPADVGAIDKTTGISWDDQNFDMLTKGHTANFLIGANLPVVAFYGGIGFSITQTNLKLNGYFPIPVLIVSNPPNTEVTNASAMEDPIDIEIKNSDGSVTSPRYNIGMRFKFAVITLHFDYTYANYSVATAGVGISFR